jgi:hypothetical protein
MLAAAPGLTYVHEPFNPLTPPGICSAPFDRMYTYVTRANEARYLPGLERTLSLRYGVASQARATRGFGDTARAIRDAISFTRGRISHSRPLVKDPIAVFSAEWLADRFQMDVVLVARHPAAVVSSLVRLGWKPRFGPILADEQLMADHLAPFEPELAALSKSEGDLVSHGALLWRLVYHCALTFRAAHPEWTFVRHEDVSRDPLAEFAQLYDRLGLDFSSAVQRGIERHSRSGNPTEIRKPHAITADSGANVENWKRRLSAEDITVIRRSVEDVSHAFYSDADW